MDDELVEKVARAICETPGYEDDWVNPVVLAADSRMSDEDCRDIYRDMARAAIAAMREAGWTPTYPNNDQGTRPAGSYVVIGDRQYRVVETKKPATSEGAG